MAGIIGARGNDGYGVTGVAQRVSIMPIRVLDDAGSGETSQIAQGFDWAASHGAKVVNASFGGPDADPVLEAAIQGNPSTLLLGEVMQFGIKPLTADLGRAMPHHKIVIQTCSL